MADIAIPLVLFGAAYLMSNDPNQDEKTDTCFTKYNENFTTLEDSNKKTLIENTGQNEYYPNTSNSRLNFTEDNTMTQYQDKYFSTNDFSNTQTNSSESFQSMNGTQIDIKDFNHNNMNLYYGGKSTGSLYDQNTNSKSILDNYTGSGAYDIKKEEIASMFKPENNMQNVYGNGNQNDFYQSRTQCSMRHANAKPWEEISVAPKDYNNNRESWQPKTVDDLRVKNNPKKCYSLENHVGPAHDSMMNNRNIQGKIVKQTPDSYFVNNNNLGMIPTAAGYKKNRSGSQQMLTKENRDTTSVEYYGAQGGGTTNTSYNANIDFGEPQKQQLSSLPAINLTNQEINPAASLNYGKNSYNIDSNNRTTVKSSYYGNVGNIISDITAPILNGLRHSKKTNTIRSLQNSGNIGSSVKSLPASQNTIIPPTNRQMYDPNLNLNHLNVQGQSDATRVSKIPEVSNTQRGTANETDGGPASSYLPGNKSYFAEYNQRNINKVHDCSGRTNGNMSLFNNKIVSQDVNKEKDNTRLTPFYNPTVSAYDHGSSAIGQFTNMPQNYPDNYNNKIDGKMLDAFKNNPYTQPLNSVA
jgi:hypothetical protein